MKKLVGKPLCYMQINPVPMSTYTESCLQRLYGSQPVCETEIILPRHG